MNGDHQPSLIELEDFFKSEEPKKLPQVTFNICGKQNLNNLDISKEKEKIYLKLTRGEVLFKKKMLEGWNFEIEFKSINKINGMMFEGCAYCIKNGVLMLESKKEAKGKDLEELFINFFGKEEYDKLIQHFKE